MDSFPLHQAVKEHDMTRVKQLIRDGEKVNARDESGKTPLHYAARAMDTEMMSFLILSGANANAIDHQGFTPFLEILEEQRESLAALMKETMERLERERVKKGSVEGDVIDL